MTLRIFHSVVGADNGVASPFQLTEAFVQSGAFDVP